MLRLFIYHGFHHEASLGSTHGIKCRSSARLRASWACCATYTRLADIASQIDWCV